MGYKTKWLGVTLACASMACAWSCGGSTHSSSGSGGTAGNDAAAGSGGISNGGTGASSTGGTGATSTGGTGATSTGGSGGTSTGGSGGVPDGSAGASGSGGAGGSGGFLADAGALGVGGCSADPPPGAPQAPDPKPYSAGTCPTFPATWDAAGPNHEITFTSSGKQRTFMLVLPDNMQPGEKYPILFLWHWLGGSAKSFYDKGDVQNAANAQRFIAVLPESEGAYIFGISAADMKWPYDVTQTPARVNEELTFFDDMLSCVSQQYNVNKNCVSSIGVSAGALWTDQLIGRRSEYLSSFESLSGGVGTPGGTGAITIKPWTEWKHPIPGIVLWGGPSDQCVLQQFAGLSHNLETALIKDGTFFAECIHNCGHAEPPFNPPSGYTTYAGLWQFVLDHPYWLPKGYSPYVANGLPVSDPPWCGLGPGSATPRTGTCPPPACPF